MTAKNIKNGPDPLCKGLRFDSGRWIRRFKTKAGSMRQYTFGHYPDISIEQARAYVESVRGQDSPLITAMSEPTIGDLIDKYLNEYIKAQRTAGALANVRSALVRNLQPIHTRRLDEVNAAVLHELILKTKARAPTMAQLMRSELKQAWSYALSIGMTATTCPITSLTGGRFRTHARDRILGDNEIRALLSNLNIYSPALADVIVISLFTGLRSGEVVQIRDRELEHDDAGVLWLTIPRSRMKNKQAHRVPLTGWARTLIDRRRGLIEFRSMRSHTGRVTRSGNNGYLFPKPRKTDTPIEQATLAREVYRIAGPVDDWHLHDLRRTTRTTLQRIGCPFEVSETILAHKLPGVAGVYARFRYNDEKVKWLQALCDHYDQLMG